MLKLGIIALIFAGWLVVNHFIYRPTPVKVKRRSQGC